MTSRLFRGHLVFDIDVPSMLLDQCNIREGEEFTKMRYTAVTGDPNDFVVSEHLHRKKPLLVLAPSVAVVSPVRLGLVDILNM